jgi:O-antigen biosynthesis protein
MKLSVVIVNYNVKHFLEQCLMSVERAIRGLEAEVWVVDNRSVDGSVTMVLKKFPWVKLIANQDNPGFSKANNQAIRESRGEYVLLLNPDTVVEEDTFRKVCDFMDRHPDAGGLGVKMVDGKGNFLPESKRGMPTPETAFYKIFGISRLFPGHKRFNRYYLGHLDKNQTHEIEILSGAFMLMRKKALDQVGLLDEDFFMYGEDIDLSWRLILGGWKNYYFPETTIIHYKGESTKKGSLNYVFVFYNAMIIFARKHFSSERANLYSSIIKLAVYMRAGVAVLNRFVKRIALPLLDFAAVFIALQVLKTIYSDMTGILYRDELVNGGFAVFSAIWLAVVWLSGGYDSPGRLRGLFRGFGLATASVLILYSLLPEDLRFSRALLLMGSAAAAVLMLSFRWIGDFIGRGKGFFHSDRKQRFCVVSGEKEFQRISELIRQTVNECEEIIFIPYEPGRPLEELDEFVRVHRPDQVVYSAADVPSGVIISSMTQVRDKKTDFKIAPPETLYMIGSNSINTPGDLLMLDINSIDRVDNRRAKRLIDILLVLALLPALPVLFFLKENGTAMLVNWFGVLFGRKTWVGYKEHSSVSELPKLAAGVLQLGGHLADAIRDAKTIERLNLIYAKDYRWQNDPLIVLKSLGRLGGRKV